MTPICFLLAFTQSAVSRISHTRIELGKTKAIHPGMAGVTAQPGVEGRTNDRIWMSVGTIGMGRKIGWLASRKGMALRCFFFRFLFSLVGVSWLVVYDAWGYWRDTIGRAAWDRGHGWLCFAVWMMDCVYDGASDTRIPTVLLAHE
ncbi:hypothetical protein B0J15DRAFT_241870 [Fusarium solani]|uniref:Uncharacterized protein n=1 Tax=Fusarium solani TaxID=169388 RepID=A0A9P9KKF0_FUSSL|nr:uncharacterized protein B0J15DRAFT_241870 [Fusarium solani]KAH7266232.1 hypothetical protein B0J15DRAFT_241870 [Fusarium solani]